MKKLSLFVTGLLLSSILYSCGSMTYITDTWKSKGFTGKKFSKLAILAVTKDNIVARRTIEDAMSRELKASGINAITTYDILAYDAFDKDKDGKVDDKTAAEKMIVDKMKENNIDGIMIMKVKDTKSEQKYVPGTPTYMPSYYYAPYYSYYFMSYNTLYSPGYYVTDTEVYIETSIYDNDNGEVDYSMVSETVNPSSITDFTKSFVKATVEQLVNNKILLK